MAFKKEDINVGGSIFWIVFTLIALAGSSYLLIWSFFNDSVKGVVISLMVVTLTLSGLVTSRLKIFDFFSWGDNALSFTLGFAVWGVLGGLFGGQSILSVSQNYLFATIASELPQIVEVVMNVFVVPIAEEIFWMVGIPFTLITIMNQVGKRFSIWKNDILQMLVIIIIAGVSFALFHVGKAFTSFIIAAIIFRTILIVMVYGDYKFDIIKGVNLVAGFALGAHIANNLFEVGFQKTWIVLQQSLPLLIIIILLFAAIFFSALDTIIKMISGKKVDNKI